MARRGFVGGYELETLALGLPFMAAFLDPGSWGREFATALDQYENMAGMWIVGEDMPQESNRVTLNSDVTDQYGIPCPTSIIGKFLQIDIKESHLMVIF